MDEYGYIDEDTGEFIPESALSDTDSIQLGQPYELPNEPGWGEVLTGQLPASIYLGAAGLGQGIEQVGADLLDFVGADKWSQSLQDLANYDAANVAAARQKVSADLLPGSAKSMITNAGEVMYPMASLPFTGPAGAAGIFAADAAAKGYGARRQEGYDPLSAAAYTAPEAAISGVAGLAPALMTSKPLLGMGIGAATNYLGTKGGQALSEFETGEPLPPSVKALQDKQSWVNLLAMLGVPLAGRGVSRVAQSGVGRIAPQSIAPEQVTIPNAERPTIQTKTFNESPEAIVQPEPMKPVLVPEAMPPVTEAPIEPIVPSERSFITGENPFLAERYSSFDQVGESIRAETAKQAAELGVPLESGKVPAAQVPEASVQEPIRVEAPNNGQGAFPGMEPVKTSPQAFDTLDNFATIEVPIKKLKLSKEVPNFKRDANPETGTVAEKELKGKYQRLGTAPIVVWQRNNGDMEVITGRHRYDLAKRTGENSIPAQIVKESDGFTKEHAHILDAESNIRDDKGEGYDYGLYFRNRGISEAEATQRGLLSTSKGREGFAIATRGSEEVYQLHQNNKLTDRQAAAIANAAPENAEAQNAGIRSALNGDNLLKIANTVKAADLVSSGRLEIISGEQGDFLRDSSDMARKQAYQEKLAQIATERQKNLLERYRAGSSGKRAALAGERGINADWAKIGAEDTNLQKEIARWESWNSDPEIMAQIRAQANAEITPQTPSPSIAEPRIAPRIEETPPVDTKPLTTDQVVSEKKPVYAKTEFTIRDTDGEPIGTVEGVESNGWILYKTKGKAGAWTIAHKDMGIPVAEISASSASGTKQAGDKLAKQIMARISRDVSAAQVQAETESGRIGPASDALARIRNNPRAKIPPFRSERGAVVNPIGEIKAALENLFTPEGTQEHFDRMAGPGRGGIQPREASTNFFEGRFGRFRIPGYSENIVNPYRQAFIFPKTVAEKFPEFDPIYRTALDQEKNVHSIANGLGEKLKSYYKLPNKNAVDSVLIRGRIEADKGTPIDLSPAGLENVSFGGRGLSPTEKNAIATVRSTMDSALQVIERTLKVESMQIEDPAARAAKQNEIDSFIREIKDKNYVPLSRFGKLGLVVKDAEGKVEWLSLHESAAERDAMAASLKKEGRSFQGFKLKDNADGEILLNPFVQMGGKFSSLDPASYAELSKKFSELGISMTGFSKHFVGAKYVPGFSPDMGRALSDYVLSLANWSSKKVARAQYNVALKNLEGAGLTDLLRYGKTYSDYMLSNSSEWSKLRRFLSVYYLGAVPRSALLNLTQSITTTWPELSKYTRWSAAKTGTAMADAVKYLSKPEAFARKNPELAKAIQSGIEQGYLDAAGFSEMHGRVAGIDPTKFSVSDAAMWMFQKAEKFNRTAAFIASWKAGKENGLQGPALSRFAEDFTETTQFHYGKANRPEIARGAKGAAFTFRQWGGNFFRLLRNNTPRENWLPLLRQLSAIGLLGGGTAIPIANYLVRGAEAAGVNPVAEFRKWIEEGNIVDGIVGPFFSSEEDKKGFKKKLSGALTYGVPYTFGANISGSVSMNEATTLLDPSKSPMENLAMTALGVPADLFYNRPKKALQNLNKYDNPYRAVEALLPESLRNLAVAGRASGISQDLGLTKEPTGFNTPAYTPLVPDPTGIELFSKALGVNPSRLGDAYQMQKEIGGAVAEATDKDNIYFKIAKAIADKDPQRQQELIDYAQRQGWKLNRSSLKEQLFRIYNPRAAEIKGAPKAARGKVREIQAQHGF